MSSEFELSAVEGSCICERRFGDEKDVSAEVAEAEAAAATLDICCKLKSYYGDSMNDLTFYRMS